MLLLQLNILVQKCFVVTFEISNSVYNYFFKNNTEETWLMPSAIDTEAQLAEQPPTACVWLTRRRHEGRHGVSDTWTLLYLVIAYFGE